MQCNFVFPESINRFPEGTTRQQISENSAEYFSCCFIGCSNFVQLDKLFLDAPSIKKDDIESKLASLGL